MAWYLNPALSQMRAEVNAEYPDRDKASDGTIGNEAHQATRSDHNKDPDGSVDAWDMDVEVRGPGQPYAADVERLKRAFEAHPSSAYWIHDDRIALRSEGWRPRSYAYAGPNRNRHDKHVHWNTRESHEDVTTPFGITEDEMTPEEVAAAVWAANALEFVDENGNGVRDSRTPKDILYSTHRATLRALAEAVALRSVVDSLAAAILAGGGSVDTAAILAGVDERLAALPPVVASAVISEIAS